MRQALHFLLRSALACDVFCVAGIGAQIHTVDEAQQKKPLPDFRSLLAHNEGTSHGSALEVRTNDEKTRLKQVCRTARSTYPDSGLDNFPETPFGIQSHNTAARGAVELRHCGEAGPGPVSETAPTTLA